MTPSPAPAPSLVAAIDGARYAAVPHPAVRVARALLAGAERSSIGMWAGEREEGGAGVLRVRCRHALPERAIAEALAALGQEGVYAVVACNDAAGMVLLASRAPIDEEGEGPGPLASALVVMLATLLLALSVYGAARMKDWTASPARAIVSAREER